MVEIVPQIKETTILSIPYHEILLSFNSDDDAIVFVDWWKDEGAVLFNEWIKKQEDNL